MRSLIPPSLLDAALLCFKPNTVILSRSSLASLTSWRARDPLGPVFGGDSLDPMPRSTAFCIVAVSILAFAGLLDTRLVKDSGVLCRCVCAEPCSAAPRPLRIARSLRVLASAAITKSPSLSILDGVPLRFCMPPRFGWRVALRRADCREARGPEGAEGACCSIVGPMR